MIVKLLDLDLINLNLDDKEILTNQVKIERHFQPVIVDDIDILIYKTRNLDFYQKKVIERGISYAREKIKSRDTRVPLPKPCHFIIYGGAGCETSNVVNILKQ